MDIKQTNLALLPYEPHIIIKDITQKINVIELMSALLHQLHHALCHFENNELSRFDAQVGETLCQIRAYKIYYLAAYSSHHFLEQVGTLKIRVLDGINTLSMQAKQFQQELRLHKNERSEFIRSPMTLSVFFKELKCLIPLSDDTLFLFSSFFLCHYHVVDDNHIPMAINFNAIEKELSLSRSFAKKLGHFHQKRLSELSCDFIFNLVKELPESQELESILPLVHHKADEGRMVLPCYCVTEIIVLHMIEKNANMLFLVDVITPTKRARIPLFLRGSKKQQNFELIEHDTAHDEPCMVMYGSRKSHNTGIKNIQKQLLLIGIKEVILSNNAAHPQYSGKTLSSYRENHYATLISERTSLSVQQLAIIQKRANHLAHLKHRANILGCTSDNPALFVLQHIYCSTIKNDMQRPIRVQ
ncbi:hypothetical protein [Legionella shakespearei]|uniref:Uncharacterized protein n=1 Tax=Legionella shakespearei DSM 23087 TaxID=1122169 RepID=A0A0W0YHA0_9GAMM|nr:hypothetical protein [Legionella shakespearei]KTD56226.1 hypothetical protein Lsha_2914 [Legionella shakespearei DSM 23087]